MCEPKVLQEYLQKYEELILDKDRRPGRDTFVTDFQKIKRDSEKLVLEGQTVATEGVKEFNRKKNRYKDILPFDHSRVILKRNGNDEGADYINANYIMSPEGKKGYIASQGPTPSTVDDFWHMIWQHKVKVVVMACKEIELGKHRCQRYWPVNGEQLNFGRITVKLVKENCVAENLTERVLRAVVGTEEHTLSQLHYTAWPDHGVPKTTKKLIKIIETMREIHPWDDPPVLLHCSAGCGRTGVMVAVDYGRRLLRKKLSKFDVYDIVMTLRKQRPAMVQSREQYEFLHEVFKDLIQEQLKKQNDFSPSYVNIEFPAKEKEEDMPLYENFDIIQMAKHSPKPSSNGSLGKAQGFILQERLEESRKPMVTTNIMNPQKAVINTEIRSANQKPVSRPNNKENLMDKEMNESQLPAPLAPMIASPVTVPKIQSEKVSPNREHVLQNYVNFEVGPKPQVPAKKGDLNLEQRSGIKINENIGKTDNKPILPAKSAPALGQSSSSPPKLPVKPKNGKNNTEKTKEAVGFDTVDGKKPPLPLKLRDLAEFESLPSPDAKEVKNPVKDMTRINDTEALFGTVKTRSLERGNNVRLDLWKKYDPDYENAPVQQANLPSSDSNSRRPETTSGKSSSTVAANARVEPSKTVSKEARNTAISINGEANRTEANAPKILTTREIFTPFEPSNTVRVTPVAQRAANEPKPEASKSANDNRMRSAEAFQAQPRFQKTDGLVGRTNASVIRKGSRKDGLVDRMNYIVSVDKSSESNTQQQSNQQSLHKEQRPVVVKAKSAECMLPLGKQDFSSHPKTTRMLSEGGSLPGRPGRGPGSNDGLQNGLDSVDGESAYAVVVDRGSKETPLYESIWTQSKQKPGIKEKPHLSPDVPPSLPPRTPESFILVGQMGSLPENAHNSEENTGSPPAVPTQNTAVSSSDQASFPWLSAGVDKLKKITNLKGAFSGGLKPAPKQNAHSSSNSSAFYTPTPHQVTDRSVSPKLDGLEICKQLQCSPDRPLSNIISIKSHRTGSSTLANILYRYGDVRNLTFVLPNAASFQFYWPLRFHTSHARVDLVNKHKPNMAINIGRFNRNQILPMLQNDTVIVAIIRDPVYHFESVYEYADISKLIGLWNISRDPFGTFLEAPRNNVIQFVQNSKSFAMELNLLKNGMVFDFGLDYENFADKDAIQQFINKLEKQLDLVLIADHFDESLILMKRILCWDIEDVIYIKQKARNPVYKNKISKKQEEIIRDLNKADVMLYDHFNKSLWDKISQQDESFYDEVNEFRIKVAHVKEVCFKNKDVKKSFEIPYLLRKSIPRELKEVCNKLKLSEKEYVKIIKKKQEEEIKRSNLEFLSRSFFKDKNNSRIYYEFDNRTNFNLTLNKK